MKVWIVSFLKSPFLYLWAVILVNAKVFAQISVLYPKERAVFQRNNDNSAKIQISGNLDQYADRVEARLVPRASTFGVQTDWQIIDSSIDGMSFTGSIEGKGGWYRLELRAVVDNNITQSNAVERVGIGEVFIIAGQSNAQGEGPNPNAKGANDDRVNTFSKNYFNHKTFVLSDLPSNFEYGSFVQVSQNTNIGPVGYTPWAYGELGDLLVSRLNVPVLFLNASISGTSSDNWFKSIRGDDTYHAILGEQLKKFSPYIVLRTTLQSYIKVLGLRAILWHQGEFDFNVNETTYYDNIKRVIDETRSNTGRNVPWVISRVSRLFGRNFPQVISAQNRLIANVSNTWPGPATDGIQPDRPDGAHFENNNQLAGLTALAQAWNNSLTNDFFKNIVPITSDNIIEIKHECVDQNNVRVKFDNNYTFYQWSNNNTSSQQVLNNGELTANLRDGFGNYLITSKLVIRNAFPKIIPSLTANPGLKVCEGNSVLFEVVNPKYQVVWDVGFVGPKFLINVPGSYSANYLTVQGCFSSKSETKTLEVVKRPEKPIINAKDDIKYTCDGNTLEFYILNTAGLDIKWSTGHNSIGIAVNKNLGYPIKVTTFSNFDCPSPESDSIDYKILENPKTPELSKFGPYTLSALTSESVSRFDWFLDNRLLKEQNLPSINIQENGFYSVKAVNAYNKPDGSKFECFSGQSTQLSVSLDSKQYGISVFPNPSTDGTIYASSNLDLKNVTYRLVGVNGQVIDNGDIGDLSFPVKLDFKLKHVTGKYFLELYYSNLKRVFPVIFE